MYFKNPPMKGEFLRRQNRFLGKVRINGETISCFIPNPGRMRELLYPGSEVYLVEKTSDKRKTRFDLVLVNLDGVMVSIDSRTPNQVIAEAITNNLIPEFYRTNIERKEYSWRRSRIDFVLRDESKKIFLEVKSCTLVQGNIANFPDAPTERGSRHLKALVDLLSFGRASILFLILRSDAKLFQPNSRTDPNFTKNLANAFEEGVEIYAYDSRVSLRGVSIKNRVPVKLF
jgi:sugar fermentation stimulation protein A